MRSVYLDNAASTKIRKEVLNYLVECLEKYYANPSSVHSMGRESRVMLEKARATVASLLNVKTQDILFTSGATESNNLAIRGLLSKTDKKEIITSNIEHSSILKLMNRLSDEGYIVHYVKTLPNGQVDVEDLKEYLNTNTALVSVMAVNNETGVRQPIDKISKLLANTGIYFHVDGAQLLGKMEVDPYLLGIDSMTGSAHKFYGPKGVGILYLRDDIPVEKLIYGGPQERNKRSGTENLDAILASAYALELAYKNMKDERAYIKELNRYLLSKLSDKCIVNGENRIDDILSIQVKGKNIQTLLPMLDMKGIMVSGGSACMSGSFSASPVLIAMGLSEQEANSSIRVSLGLHNTKEEIDYFIDCLEKM